MLAATEALLLEGGVDAVSIRRVSSRCGYSAPTIYHHFGDKNGLVAAVLERRFRRHLDMMRSIPRGDDAALYLRKMAVEFLRFALPLAGLCAGSVAGSAIGTRLLDRVPERAFRTAVKLLLSALAAQLVLSGAIELVRR